MFNKIILAGHLTKDPVLRYTPQGMPVTTISIAVNTVIGPDREDVLFIDVITFNRQAEKSAEYLLKGYPVLVEGRLTCRKWEGADGTTHQKYEVIASAVRFLPRGNSKTEKVTEPAAEPAAVTEMNEEWDPF